MAMPWYLWAGGSCRQAVGLWQGPDICQSSSVKGRCGGALPSTTPGGQEEIAEVDNPASDQSHLKKNNYSPKCMIIKNNLSKMGANKSK